MRAAPERASFLSRACWRRGSTKLSQGKLRQAQSFAISAAAGSAAEAAADQVLLDQVIDFYHDTLKASPEALAYLDRRGLGKLELIERFKLGYANRTLAYRLAPKQYKAGAELRAALQRVGILRESGHEHFNGSIVIPLFGESAAPSTSPDCASGVHAARGEHRLGDHGRLRRKNRIGVARCSAAARRDRHARKL
jgi:hypothetical protein